MNLIQRIKQCLKGEKETIEAPEGYCPNCWGRQEYQGKILKAVKQENIDLNNLNAKKGWIQAYAIEQFEGIKIKPKGDVLECQACKIIYKPE